MVRGHGPKRGTFRGAIDGARVWWIAPTYPVANEIIWPDLKRALWQAAVDKSESEHYIELPGGGSVSVKSADNPDSLRGAGLDGVVFDEAAFAKERVWSEVVSPMLADRMGWAIFPSTPNGCNWFYDLYQNAHGEDWARWQSPTSVNPLIKPKELERQKQRIGLRAFAQEFEAQFTSQAGAEFPADYFRDSIWFDDWPADEDIRFRVVALDPSLGKTDKSDYSAFVSLALDWSGTMWIDADMARRDPRTIVDDGMIIVERFKPDAFGVEAVGFQSILADIFAERSKLKGLMLPLHAIHNTEHKRTRIRARLTPYLARGEFRFKRGSPGAKLLVDQTRAFPIERHDDGPDALEMAVRLTQHLFGESTEGEL